ncbi:peptidoglycan-binding domain-containing protein, partial [Shouchella shacheensis]|uniref:peptidoglycan-binding domain-containing protein n=1 Tax=Shouchella shacheensis TaxID=1649580 RepID=UPI000A501562
MKRNVPFKVFRNIGLPVVAAGAVLFTAPTFSEAAANPLYKGDNGEKVEHLQELLAQQGYLKTDKVTGTYKGSTKEAVTTYQQKHDLAVDGIAGVQTVGALTELSYGDEGALVKDLQKQLNDLQFYKGELDGAFGPLTDEAVRNFQASVGIAVDGYAGPETYRELYYRQPAQAPVTEEQPKQEQAEQEQAAQEQAEQE